MGEIDIIETMKKGIDHIGVCVVFYCHDGKGKFLLSKRTKYCRDEHGRWDPGGGGVNFGERLTDALRREIKEEYCTDVLEHEFLGMRDVHRIDERGRKTHWISIDFKVLVDTKRVANGDPKKHEEIGWFTLENLPEPIHSQMPDFVKRYKDRLL